MTKLSEKFEICTKHNRTSRYQLSLNKDTGKYSLQNVTSLEDAYNIPITYSARLVQEALDCGNWIMTKNLSEPELALPFTVEHPDSGNMFEITRGSKAGYTSHLSLGSGKLYENNCTDAECKRFIKDGIWIVKHVGEKAPEQVEEDRVLVVDGAITATGVTNNGKDVHTMRFVADVNDAVLSVDRLAQAYESLAVSMESCLALNEKLKGLVQ